MRRAALAAALALAACDAPSPPPPPRASGATSAGPASSSPPVASASQAPPGPADGAAAAAREASALALLEGKVDPLHFPEVMTDPGDAFDRGLRDRLTTREAKAPLIKLVDKKITGKLEEADVARGVRQRFGQLRICYEGRLGDHPGLKGKLQFKLVVSPEGGVSSVTPSGGDLKDADLKTCAQKALQAASFPKPEGGGAVVLEIGLSFDPP